MTTSTNITDSNLAGFVGEAIEQGLAGAKPTPIGDFGQAFIVPTSSQIVVQDVRTFEDRKRDIGINHTFTSIDSLGRYIDRFGTADTLGYIKDIYGERAEHILTAGFKLATYVIDDHTPRIRASETNNLVENKAQLRSHTAAFLLRPTAAAKRWGEALSIAHNQDSFLDLIDEGIAEIVDPDGADLRDLIRDLHAVRSSELKSVIGTGGSTKLAIAENVSLHGGVGNTLEVPERIRVSFQPFVNELAQAFWFDVKVKVSINSGNRPYFALTAPDLPTALADAVVAFTNEIETATGIAPFTVS